MSEQSKGYWKHGTTAKSYVRTCSVCGERSYFVGIGEYPFCPYCKAEMNEPNERAYTVKKYIDADALIDFANNHVAGIDANDIARFPRADVQKVRHGEWVEETDEYMICATEFTCSVCNKTFCSSELTDKEFYEMMKHCPNCGAKMDGKEIDE